MSDTTEFDEEAVPEDEQSARGRDAYTLDLDNEDELQQWLVKGFESNGWDAIREVSPDNSNYRVDLLCIHPKFGRVGIETKYVRPGEGGKKIAQAHQQITQQYWNKKYWGDKILLWALCPYFARAHLDDPDRYNRTKSSERSQFTREFFAHYGIGCLNPSKGYNLISYNHSVNERKIPAFSVNDDIPWRYYESADIEELRESVREKRGVEFE